MGSGGFVTAERKGRGGSGWTSVVVEGWEIGEVEGVG